MKGRGLRQLATEVDDLAQSLIKDKKLKNSLWRLFLIELEEDARVLTERKLSYLSNTTYEGLAQFDWFYVVEEMLRYQPLLTDVLLAVSTSRKNIQSNDHYNSISKELGLIYGILMKRCYKDLSRIQRVMAMALADEKVHQKASSVTELFVVALFRFQTFSLNQLILV